MQGFEEFAPASERLLRMLRIVGFYAESLRESTLPVPSGVYVEAEVLGLSRLDCTARRAV